MKMQEQLNILNDTIQQANDMLSNAQKSIDIVMEGMMQSATDDQIRSIQEQTKQIKLLLNKAKKGENVDTEINNMTKIIKDGSRDIK
jgi:uncharacterized protein with von Willebrand factor type A (vWA) domain